MILFYLSCAHLYMFFFLIKRRPPRSTRTDTLFPYTTLFRSDLTAARILRVGERGAGRGRAFLERRVERDLGILLVEDILRPEFDAPFLVGSAHAEARVEQRIAVLRLLREQVRPGVVIPGHAAIDIAKAGQQIERASCKERECQP